MRAAVEHYVTHNCHHPEFHASPNHMSELNVIKMVSYWTATAQEFNLDGDNARGWADKTIGSCVHFHEEKCCFICAIIDLLGIGLCVHSICPL